MTNNQNSAINNHFIKIILGIVIIIIGVFFFGDNFIENFLWKGCYDGGYPGDPCEKSNLLTFKAFKAILLVAIGMILIVWGIIKRRKL